MVGERISLTWKDHHSSLVALVETLLGNNWLVDCTLAAEGKYLKAHKVILSACSPYFQLLFNQESEKNPIVILKDVKYEYLKFIIDFIYRGKVDLRNTQLNDFLELAQSLQVKGLDSFHGDQNSESTKNSEPASIGASEKSQQTEKSMAVEEQKEDEDCEIIDNVDVSEESHNTAVPTSQEEQGEPEVDDEEATVTIESSYSIASVASYGDSELDAHQWSLPMELPVSLPPRSPSELTDHSVDTVIIVHPDDETVESVTDLKNEDRRNSWSESSRTPSRNSLSINEDIPLSSLSLSRSSSPIDITEAIKKDHRLNPRVYVNKLNINSLTPTWKPSKSQVKDNGSSTTEGTSIESGSAGRELFSASRSILSAEQSSKQPNSLDGTLLDKSYSEPSIPPNSSNLSSESSTPGICKRVSLMKVPSRTLAKRYKCTKCLKSFLHDNELTIHMKLHSHSTKKPYQCPQCLKFFTRADRLSDHRLIHEGVHPYQCSQCLKRFSQSGNLATHMRIHTGVRPFKCPHCHRSFSQATNLASHVRVHTGEKPFKCKICNKHFKRAGTLKIHLRIHSGERPYECEHCGRKFSSNSQLWAHKRHYEKYVS